MARYTVKHGDKAYRKVNIRSTVVPKYEDVPEVGQVVNYPDNLVVLEVLRNDGTSEIYYDGPTFSLRHINAGTNIIAMDKDIPTERLWIRGTDGTGIPYKVPTNLPVIDGRIEFYVPYGAQRAELFGDKYFEKVYDLK